MFRASAILSRMAGSRRGFTAKTELIAVALLALSSIAAGCFSWETAPAISKPPRDSAPSQRIGLPLGEYHARFPGADFADNEGGNAILAELPRDAFGVVGTHNHDKANALIKYAVNLRLFNAA